jgi:hypothetical protein
MSILTTPASNGMIPTMKRLFEEANCATNSGPQRKRLMFLYSIGGNSRIPIGHRDPAGPCGWTSGMLNTRPRQSGTRVVCYRVSVSTVLRFCRDMSGISV